MSGSLNRLQVERMFSELRREGRDSNIPVEVFTTIREGFIASHPELSDEMKEEVESQFALSAEHDADMGSDTIYALSTLARRVRERETAVKEFFEATAERTGMTFDEVKQKFWDEYNSVDTSRGSETPAEYDQNTRRQAVIANLPYDRASVTAFERLRRLGTSERVRRVELVDPAVPSSAVRQFGWHNGRLEIVFHSNPDRIYSYRNVSEAQWDELRESSSPGRAWRFLRSNPEYAYDTQEEADEDGYATRCMSCGQFRSATGHVCPSREQRENLLNNGLTTEEVNTELETAHPEEVIIADRTEDDEPEPEISAAEEVLLEELRRALSGEDEEEVDADDPELASERAVAETVAQPSRTAARPARSVTPAETALPDMPDLREDSTGKVERNVSELSYDHEKFISLDSLVEQTANNEEQNVIARALLAKNNSNYTPLALEASEGNHLKVIRYVYEIERQNWTDNPDLKATVTDFFEKFSEGDSSHYSQSKGVAILEAAGSTRDAGYRGSVIVKIVALMVDNQVDIQNGIQENSRYNPYVSVYKKVLLTPKENRYVVSERTEEQRDQYTTTFESETERLIEEGSMVRCDGGATLRISTLDHFRGYTKQGGSIRSNLPSKPALAAAYKDGKAVVSKVEIAYDSPSLMRDGIMYSDGSGGSISGEIMTRMTPEGEVQIIGQNLKCNCWDYRNKYNCSHIGLAIQDMPKIFQGHSKPQPPLPEGVGDAGRDAVRRSRSTAYSIATNSETGRSYVRVAHPRRGTPFAANVRLDRAGDGSRLPADDIALMHDLMSTDPERLTDSDREFIYRHYTGVNAYENAQQRSGIRISPLTNQAYLGAVPDSDVMIPVNVSFPGERSWYSTTVSGTVLFGAGSTPENPIISERKLKCTCPEYRQNYRCEHVDLAVEKYIRGYLMPAEQIAGSSLFVEEVDENVQEPVSAHDINAQFHEILMREQEIDQEVRYRGGSRDDAIERIEAREEAERVRQAEEAARIEAQSAAYKDYRELRLAAWQQTDTPLADDIDGFKAEVEDLRRRKRRGERVLEPLTENVTDGVCAEGEGTRSFGIELEFDIKSGVDRSTALANIGRELHEAGLTTSPRQQYYHSANGSWESWSFEQDCTVAGEIVSPIMKDTPEHWEQLKKVVEIVERNGGKASTRAGSHVNISSGSLGLSTAKHAELTRVMKENQDLMFRLASDPGRGSHRGSRWCHPNIDVAAQDIPEEQLGRARGTTGTHGTMLNFDASFNAHDVSKSRVEFRLWDSTLDVGVIQQQVAISAALTDYAEREVITNKGYKSRSNTPVEQDADGDVRAAKLFDRLFRTSEQRKAATKLFAITNPV